MFERIRIIFWFLEDVLQGKTTLLGGKLRSSGWYQFRKIHIKKECCYCGRKGTFLKPLQLHHLRPFHLFPEDELNPDNVETFCNECHLREAHLMSYKSFNINVKEKAKIMREEIKNRP